MNPFDIIGWAIVFFGGVFIIAFLGSLTIGLVSVIWTEVAHNKRRRARNNKQKENN